MDENWHSEFVRRFVVENKASQDQDGESNQSGTSSSNGKVSKAGSSTNLEAREKVKVEQYPDETERMRAELLKKEAELIKLKQRQLDMQILQLQKGMPGGQKPVTDGSTISLTTGSGLTPDQKSLPSNSSSSALPLPQEKSKKVESKSPDPRKNSWDPLKRDESSKEEEEIATAAFERAKVEIATKTGALRDLQTQKEDAVKKITELQSKSREIKLKMETKKRSLEEASKEKKIAEIDLAEVEEEKKMIKKKRRRLRSILQEKEDTATLLKMDVRQQEEKLVEEEEKVKNVGKVIEELQQKIKALAEAPGYNPSMLKQLEDEISEKKEGLECPVCFYQCSPPMYTCPAQHLICANCR